MRRLCSKPVHRPGVNVSRPLVNGRRMARMQFLQPRERTGHDGVVVSDISDVIAGRVLERELPVVAHRQPTVSPDVT